MPDIFNEKQLEDSLRQEFEQTIKSRVQRYLSVKPHGIIPNAKFAVASSECSLLFRDGHFYGCIALSQAVAEALVKYLCEKNRWVPANNYEENVHALHKRGFISEQLRDRLLQIWQERDTYHHLNNSIATEIDKLEQIAQEKAKLIALIEAEVFSFTADRDGRLIPRNPKYWDGNKGEVYLRLDR